MWRAATSQGKGERRRGGTLNAYTHIAGARRLRNFVKHQRWLDDDRAIHPHPPRETRDPVFPDEAWAGMVTFRHLLTLAAWPSFSMGCQGCTRRTIS